MITLMLFISNHCPGCHPMKDVCEKAVKKYSGIALEVFNIDESDEAMGLAQKFYVMSTPTTLIKKDGIIVDQIPGSVSLSELENRLAEV